jgi:hypothetical protein
VEDTKEHTDGIPEKISEVSAKRKHKYRKTLKTTGRFSACNKTIIRLHKRITKIK